MSAASFRSAETEKRVRSFLDRLTPFDGVAPVEALTYPPDDTAERHTRQKARKWGFAEVHWQKGGLRSWSITDEGRDFLERQEGACEGALCKHYGEPLSGAIERLSQPEPNSGCLIWLGNIDRHGYGRINSGQGQKLFAHRVAYEIQCAEIPADHVIDHKCRVRCCVNPQHLEPVTNQENLARGWSARSREKQERERLSLSAPRTGGQ